jgi:tetratricopeptide (TPR) repeat protein
MYVFVPALVLMMGMAVDRPATFEELSQKADQARDANHLDEAVALYKQALKLKPKWEDGWWALGSITYDQDKYAECAPAFRRLAALKPDLAAGWTMAGLCEYRLRQFSAALSSLEQAQRLGFRENTELSRSARIHLALLLTHAGVYEKAITLLTELTRIDKRSPEIMMIVGIAGLRKPWLPSEVPEAEKDKVVKLGDAMASAMEQDAKAATEKFQIAVEDYPSDANIRFRYGSFLRLQDMNRGIEEIKKAVELEPAHIPALVGLAMIYLKNGEPQIAREYGERAVKAGPNDFAARIALGRALLDLDEMAGAARELEVAIRLAPDSPDAHFSLASAYKRLGRMPEAEREQQAFKRLIKPAQNSEPGKN